MGMWGPPPPLHLQIIVSSLMLHALRRGSPDSVYSGGGGCEVQMKPLFVKLGERGGQKMKEDLVGENLERNEEFLAFCSDSHPSALQVYLDPPSRALERGFLKTLRHSCHHVGQHLGPCARLHS